MNRIQELREDRGWTQKRLAKEMHCTDVAISNYEVCRREINSDTICKLCDIFDCTADYLLCRSDVATPAIPDADAEAVLNAYNALNPYGRAELLRYLDYLQTRPEFQPGDNAAQVV